MKDDLVVRAETLTVIVTHLQVKQKESENTLTSGTSTGDNFYGSTH